MADILLSSLLGDDLDPSAFDIAAGSGYGSPSAGQAISNAHQSWRFGSISAYGEPAVLAIEPQGICGGTHFYDGLSPITLVPQANYGGPQAVTGTAQVRLLPASICALLDVGIYAGLKTRIYYGRGAPRIEDLACAPSWEKTTTYNYLASPTKQDTALSSTYGYENSELAPYDVAVVQYQSPPLRAQLISGTVKGQVLAYCNSALADFSLAIVIRVISEFGVVRGTLLSYFPSVLTSALGLTPKNQYLPPSMSLTPLAVSAGDRLVIEIGFRSFNTSTSSFYTYLNLGDAGSADLPEDEIETSALLNPWLEFSQGLLWDVEDVIEASTSTGFALGGEGVWSETAVGETVIPVNDLVETGFRFGGGAAPGEAEVVETIPLEDEIVGDDIGFIVCGPEVSGGATTSEPGQKAIVGSGGFVFGGAGVLTQVAPADIPSAVLVGSGGFLLEGTGQSTDPGVTPTITEIVGTGGFVFGGFGSPPVSVTYPSSYDRVIEDTVAFVLGGGSVPVAEPPTTTIIVSDGAIFTLSGAGLATTKSPPIVVITGDAIGGFVLGGPDAVEVFEAWVLNGQAFEPSIFSGFNFNSFAQHQEQTYAAGEDGIYLLGADYDEGETIHSGARIGPINFGSASDKRIRGIEFGKGGRDTRIRVESETGEGVFSPDRDESRVVVSRDIQGNEFIIDICDFQELSHIEITPLKLARR